MDWKRITVALCAVSLCLFAAGDPFSGTWKLNPAKSKLPPPVPRSLVSHIEADATGVRVHEQIVNDKGQRETVTVDARFDGKDYPVKGSPLADAVAYQRVDSHTLKGTSKKAGKVLVHETVVVSKDGKTMTATYSGKDANGKAVVGTAVFEKQ